MRGRGRGRAEHGSIMLLLVEEGRITENVVMTLRVERGARGMGADFLN